MTQDAINHLKKYYVDLRKQGSEEGDAVPITPRQLEAFVRMAEASAKIRLSQEVTIDDTERAIRIVEYYLKKVARDETGLFDIDRVATGTPHEVKDRIGIIKEIITILSENNDDREVNVDDIIEESVSRGISEIKAKEAINKMLKAGEIFEPSHNKIRWLR